MRPSGTLSQTAPDFNRIEIPRHSTSTRQLEVKKTLCNLVHTQLYVYNLTSYDQEYNEQPIYELAFQYSEDSESDTSILQNLYRIYL